MRRLCRGDHLFHGGVLLAVGYVLEDRAPEEPGILQHHRVGAAQGVHRIFSRRALVHAYLSRIRIVKTHEQVDDRGLARPRGADDGYGLPGTGLHVQTVQHGLAGKVAEADVPGLHVAPAVLQLRGAVNVLDLLRLVEQTEYPFRGGESGKDLVYDVGYLVYGPGELARVEHEGGYLLQAHYAEHIQYRASHADGRETHVGYHAHGGPHAHAQAVRVPVGFGGLAVDAAEVPAYPLLLGVGENGLLPGEHLLGKAVHLTVGGAAL